VKLSERLEAKRGHWPRTSTLGPAQARAAAWLAMKYGPVLA